MHTQYSTASVTRPLLSLVFALVSIGAAGFLRGCKGNAVRESITQLLGYEQRAAIEHLFAGVGIPLAVGILVLAMMYFSGWLSYKGCQWLKWTWPPLAKHPSGVATLRDLSRVVAVWSIVYVLAAALWEWNQASIGVYGSAPRGYVQWNQLCFDFVGAGFAFLVARRVGAPRQF